MSAALQFRELWGAASAGSRLERSQERSESRKTKPLRLRPAARAGRRPGVLPEAHREHVAALPVRIHAGGPHAASCSAIQWAAAGFPAARSAHLKMRSSSCSTWRPA